MQEFLKVLDLLAAGKISNQDPRVEEALREAVAFCRGAQPLDESAEREHCRYSLDKWYGAEGKDSLEVDWLMRERAQAHAEGYANGHAIAGESILECGRLRAQLSAAQAEIERFAEAHAAQTLELHDVTRQLHTVTTPSKGRPLNEERARLELREYIARAHELATKLENLRTAAERELKKATNDYVSVQHKRTLSAIRAAIEASR